MLVLYKYVWMYYSIKAMMKAHKFFWMCYKSWNSQWKSDSSLHIFEYLPKHLMNKGDYKMRTENLVNRYNENYCMKWRTKTQKCDTVLSSR
jgi:hypothetical protein